MIRVGPQIGGCQMEEDGMKVSGREDKGEVWQQGGTNYSRHYKNELYQRRHKLQKK